MLFLKKTNKATWVFEKAKAFKDKSNSSFNQIRLEKKWGEILDYFNTPSKKDHLKMLLKCQIQ